MTAERLSTFAQYREELLKSLPEDYLSKIEKKKEKKKKKTAQQEEAEEVTES